MTWYDKDASSGISPFASFEGCVNTLAKFATVVSICLALHVPATPAQEYNPVERFPAVEGVKDVKAVNSKVSEKIQLFGEILQDIQNGYVDAVDLDKLSETAFNAMLSSLDPYTEFENPKAATQLAATTFGNYAGVGLQISKPKPLDPKDKPGPYVLVRKAYEGYAYDAGIRVGDKIVEICEGTSQCKSTRDIDVNEASDLLKGPPGSKVSLRYERPGSSSIQTKILTRQQVLLRDVPVATQLADPTQGIGYVKINGFSDNAPYEVAYVLDQLQKDTPLKALVIDLRGNPGGLLGSVIQTSNLFLPEGVEVVTTRGRSVMAGPTDSPGPSTATFQKTYRVKKRNLPPVGEDVKLVVMVDERTASAAEILSGALQDHDRAVIIGRKTYGKGLVQQLDRLTGGTILKYTAGKYFTPSGRCIQSRTYKPPPAGERGATATEVPDSDRKVFYTDAGRPVRDGGGIEPDLPLDTGKAKAGGQLRIKLEQSDAFYNFASFWEEMHSKDGPAVLEAADTLVDDDLYRLFELWVKKNVPELKGPFDAPLDIMTEALKETGYDEAIGQVGALKTSLQSLLISEFKSDAPAIKRELERAIRERFEPESQVVATDVRHDPEIAEAVKIATDPVRYASIVNPRAAPAVAALPRPAVP